ncbi:MAG: DUF1592 domain-containing protein [Verrucomicrobiota bacterium]
MPHWAFRRATALLALAALVPLAQAAPTRAIDGFVQNHCVECHDSEVKKADLDLTALKFDLKDDAAFNTWVKVHDRVRDGEMPPKKKAQPKRTERDKFTQSLFDSLVAADQAKARATGRAVWRRLNRYEYENTLRDLLHAPWLQIKEMLPEDGEAHRFNKVGEALDVSHVQMARYLSAADYALRQVLATQAAKPETPVVRYYVREQPAFARRIQFNVFNRSPERATFPLLDHEAQVDVLEGKAPVTVGTADPATREREAFGVVASTYEPLEIKFDQFKAPAAGRYKLRFSAYTFWAAPGEGERWWRPDRTKASIGRRPEPVTIYSETPPRLLRRLGAFDVNPEPSVQELDVWLLEGETIRPDPARLFRSRPPNWHNPLAEKDGQPGVAFRWMEVEGPIHGDWPPAGHQLLFGDLPIKDSADKSSCVEAANPRADAERLLRSFMQRAYRRPVADADVKRFLAVIEHALDSGSGFTDAMIAGYSAVLCSPAFVCLEEKPGPLDDHALASRLSYFLWNTEPDAELRALAARGQLRRTDTLRQQTLRLLDDPKSRRFVDAFLAYWLDLRKSEATSPDAALYPDYYLDDLLVESSVAETELFFAELVRQDLPARNLVASDFAMLNERLAAHYGLPAVQGVRLRRVPLPHDSVRGGLLTQASVLKVTANGTTTSPVLRGAWVMERILGKPPPPPPASVPAVEPDTRGATTIREQLDKHRTQETCNACHAKIDPAGFALENFDVLGGWRDHYRALGDGEKVPGFGKNGQPFDFHQAQAVDASGELPDGRKFQNIRDLKRLLLEDERQLARNLAQQFTVYATGSAIRFGDRPEIEHLLDQAQARQYGVRSLILALTESPLFTRK